MEVRILQEIPVRKGKIKMNDYLKFYKELRNKKSFVLKAREIVVDLIMHNDHCTKEQAQDLLNALINDDVRAEIEGEYNNLNQIIARNSG